MSLTLAQLTDPGTVAQAQQQVLDGMAGRCPAIKTGTGTGSITLSGTPNGEYTVILTIVATGEPGVATFRYSLDGGTTQSATQTIPTSGSVVIGSTGVSVSFSAGPSGSGTSFVTGDYWTVQLFSSTLPVLAWQDGSVPKTLALIQGTSLADQRALISDMARAGFVTSQPGVTGASGDWLALAGQARYGLTLNPASPASILVVLTDAASGGPFTIQPGQLWVANTASLGSTTGQVLRYNNVNGGTLPKGGTLSLTFQAEQPGAAYDVGDNTITTLLTSLPGVTVNNPTPGGATSSITLQGVDTESDLAYSLRCLGRWAQLGTGSPAAAYDSWARTASSEVTRTLVVANGTTAGQIDLYVAGPSGSVSSAAITAITDAITPKIAFPATLNLINALTTSVTVTATVYAYSAQLAAAQAACEAALLALFQSVPIGGTIYLSAIIDAMQKQAGVRNVVVSAPVSNTVLSTGRVPLIAGTRTYTAV